MDYITKHNVPILDEHVIYDEDGKELATIDEARLKHIAQKANGRVEDTGDEVPIIIGHTKDDTEEDKQPEIVGYATNFKVQKFFKTGKKAITATFKFFKRYLNKIKKYPRRSIELWLDEWKIDPISLLGATTPERDLGLLRFQKGGSKKVHILYKKETTMPQMNDQKQIVDAVMKAIKQTDFYKWACKKMQEEGESEEGDMEGSEEMEGMDGMGGDGASGLEGEPDMMGNQQELGEEEEAGNDLDQMGDEGEEVGPDEEEGEEPVKYAASCGMPSGSNSYTPKGAVAMMNKKAKMSKKPNKIQQHRYAKALAQQAREIQSLRIKFRKSEREKDLIQLEAEGVDFDRDEELEYVENLPDDVYQGHLARMRVRYSKAPIFADESGNVFNQARSATTVPDRRALAAQAVQLAQAKGVSFEDALAQLE